MILGDLDGNLLFYVIAAVIGLISWLTKKDESGSGKPTSAPKFPRPKSAGSQKPEEDRLREFLDALGIPADQRPPVAKQTPPEPVTRPSVAADLRGQIAPASRSAPAPTSRGAPEPPPIPRAVTSRPQRRLSTPLPVPSPPRTPPEREDEWAALDEQEAPTAAVEQLHVPELVTPSLPEFVTTSSSISAIPSERLASLGPVGDAYDRDTILSVGFARQRVRTLLQSPPDVRAAIILREILGPAPGLQRPGSLPTFP
ncbi:MAG TPA: hypothetical protein VFV83_04295 [Chthoniobacteraceae bacterium]|nr:hypothetical protein [Chthoniobacteraceae bacterium]